MHFDLTDLTGVLQPEEPPGAAGVGRSIHTAAEDHIGSDGFTAGAGVHDIGVRVGHVDGADRSRGDLAVGDRHPGDAVVFRLPHAAAGGAHVEDVRLRAHARGGRGSAAAMRPDGSPAKILVRPQIDDGVRVRLGEQARRDLRIAERHQRGDGNNQQQNLFHDERSLGCRRSYHPRSRRRAQRD